MEAVILVFPPSGPLTSHRFGLLVCTEPAADTDVRTAVFARWHAPLPA